MNVGPTADGSLAPIFVERLSQVGTWLLTNAEAIYGTRPWVGSLPHGMEGTATLPFGERNNTYYTSNGGAVFAISMTYPAWDDASRACVLELRTPVGLPGVTTAHLLASEAQSVQVRWKEASSGQGIVLFLPMPPRDSANAWTVKLVGLKNGPGV
jgi:alpha-L-fucosidase